MPNVFTNSLNIFQRDEIGNVRTAQEDSHFSGATPNGYLFVVCDGMGGHVGGAEASSIAVKSIFEFFNREKYHDTRNALDDALQFANAQILGKVCEYPALKGMGTTACILLLQEDRAYIAHAGDSRIYLCLAKEKELYRITKDHSFVQTLVDLPEGDPYKISDEEAENHPDKNRILKALGIKPDLTPTICEKPILPKNGDIFLLCSDGLSGMISDSVMQSVLTHSSKLEQKGDMLITLALEAGGYDNITLQLIEILGSPHKKSDFKHCDFNPKPKGRSKSSGRKSKTIAKILIALSIVILCIVGTDIVRYYIDRNSKEKDLKVLQGERENARTKLNECQKKVENSKITYDRAVEELERAGKELEIERAPNGITGAARNTYEGIKARRESALKALEDSKNERNSAKEEVEKLERSFPTDSAKIMNSRYK